MLKTDIFSKESDLKSTEHNVIFTCDNNYPECIENVINLFKIINKSRRSEFKLDLPAIILEMINKYNVNEEETRRCIISLYLDGAIYITKCSDNIYLSSKFSRKYDYPSLFRERIRIVFLTNICKMYVKMNLVINDVVTDFTLVDLMNFLIKEDIKIRRVRMTDDLLFKSLEKLCRIGYLNKVDCKRYSLTNKTIKFGRKIEDFNQFCKHIKIEKVYKRRLSKSIASFNQSKSNFDSVTLPALYDNNDSVLKDVNASSGISTSMITTKFNQFQPVNMMANLMVSSIYNNIGTSMTIEHIPIFSQIIQPCHLCGQISNENGHILVCKDCKIFAHASCRQFFQCSKFIQWCSSCRYPFQLSAESVEEIDLLCDTCLSQRQNTFFMCLSCQDGIDEKNIEIVQLENCELKECIDNFLPKSQTTFSFNNEVPVEEYVPSNISFVEMLKDSEKIISDETFLTKSVISWTMNDVEKWLIQEGYDHLCMLFKSEEIDGKSLILLVEADLAFMKINKNIVFELYSKIKKLK